MEKLNIRTEHCSCGKHIEEYNTKNKGENVHHGYPELHCHCKCGIAWGLHAEDYKLTGVTI